MARGQALGERQRIAGLHQHVEPPALHLAAFVLVSSRREASTDPSPHRFSLMETIPAAMSLFRTTRAGGLVALDRLDGPLHVPELARRGGRRPLPRRPRCAARRPRARRRAARRRVEGARSRPRPAPRRRGRRRAAGAPSGRPSCRASWAIRSDTSASAWRTNSSIDFSSSRESRSADFSRDCLICASKRRSASSERRVAARSSAFSSWASCRRSASARPAATRAARLGLLAVDLLAGGRARGCGGAR